MTLWLTYTLLVLSAFSLLSASINALQKKPPGDWTVGAIAFTWIGFLLHLGISIYLTTEGQHAEVSTVEFYAYLITVCFIPPAAVFWTLIDYNFHSSWLLSGLGLFMIIMLMRMADIWYGTYLGAFVGRSIK